MIVAEVAERWSPGIGDPTLVGWFTVFAYFWTAWACLRARYSVGAARGSRGRAFWGVLALVLVGLGINKQLDLQGLFAMWGRDLAHAQGWYESRGLVQILFIMMLGGMGLLVVAAVGWWLRDKLRQLWIPLVGFAFLVLFVFVRAASFHHMDRLIGWRFVGLRMNWILELGGILLILYGARVFEREAQRRVAASAG